MAASSSKPNFLSVLRRIEFSLNNGNFPSLNLKPLQMKCFEYMLEGQDVIGVLPTGFGKSMLFHLLPHFIPVKTTKNIVIVVCPLNSIIEDQLKVLKARRITADVLQLAVYEKEPADNLFGNQQEPSEHVVPDSRKFPQDVVNGNTSIVFAHPELRQNPCTHCQSTGNSKRKLPNDNHLFKTEILRICLWLIWKSIERQTVRWRNIRTQCKTVCTVSCAPDESHEERHNIRNKERTIEGEGAICNISSWHGGWCSLCNQHHSYDSTK